MKNFFFDTGNTLWNHNIASASFWIDGNYNVTCYYKGKYPRKKIDEQGRVIDFVDGKRISFGDIFGITSDLFKDFYEK